MWLLDPIHFTLREFMGEGLPECAIWSHTGGEEVTFKDVQNQQFKSKTGVLPT
jgi:hypothetical protein